MFGVGSLVRKVTYRFKKPKLGLALGGGAAWGIAHIGVLQILEEEGLEIGLIAGTSAGAMVGALYAGGYDSQSLVDVVEDISWKKLVYLRPPGKGLFDSSKIEEFMESYIGKRRFEELNMPFAAVAVDLRSGKEVILTRGNVARAVRASASIPVIFTPVEHMGYLLVDGGLVNNVPVSVVRSMGADVAVAVNVSSVNIEGEGPRSIPAIAVRSVNILQKAYVEKALEQADVIIEPDVKGISVIELKEYKKLIERGRAAAKEAVGKINELMHCC